MNFRIEVSVQIIMCTNLRLKIYFARVHQVHGSSTKKLFASLILDEVSKMCKFVYKRSYFLHEWEFYVCDTNYI